MTGECVPVYPRDGVVQISDRHAKRLIQNNTAAVCLKYDRRPLLLNIRRNTDETGKTRRDILRRSIACCRQRTGRRPSRPCAAKRQRQLLQPHYLIAKPNILQGDPTPTEPPVEVIRLKNEIGQMLDSPAIEKEPLKNRIFEYASLVYETLDTTQRITEMIRATLQRTRSLSYYDGELTMKIASAITLHADKTVSLTLKNGQRIRKEKNDATDSTHIAKESTHHCSDYTAGECAQHTKHYQTGSRLLPGIHQAGRTT